MRQFKSTNCILQTTGMQGVREEGDYCVLDKIRKFFIKNVISHVEKVKNIYYWERECNIISENAFI